MRDFIISIVCMLVLIIPWGIYDNYATETIGTYKEIINDEVIPAIESNDWATAEKRFGFIAKDWDDYKKNASFFINTTSVNEVDSYVSKVFSYIKLRDAGNAAAESAFLQYRLNFLHENEIPSVRNLL